MTTGRALAQLGLGDRRAFDLAPVSSATNTTGVYATVTLPIQ